MKNPTISIIVPCYNQAQYLDECLQSVLDQTYDNWECIIINDGSPDNTEETAKKWTNKDNRFKYIFQENKGVSAARNNGIKNAKGEWILPLDGDDKIGNRYLELAEKEFDKNYTIIYCEVDFFGNYTAKWNLPKHTLENLAIQNTIFCSAFFRKNDWIEVGGYDEKLEYGYEDWEFWISILKIKINSEVLQLKSTLFYYRIKESSRSVSLNDEEYKIYHTLRYIYSKHSDFFISRLKPYQTLYLEYAEVVRERDLYKKAYDSKKYKIPREAFRILRNIFNSKKS